MDLNQTINVSVKTNNTPSAQYKTVILKPNVIDDVNTLTQAMMSQTNTKYVIKYDYVLGEDITVPANCVLEFDGGSLRNGTIVGNYTRINAGIVKIFNTDVTLSDTWNITEAYPEWFGAKANDSSIDSSIGIQKAIDLFPNKGNIILSIGIYYINHTIIIPPASHITIKGEGLRATCIKANAPMDRMIYGPTATDTEKYCEVSFEGFNLDGNRTGVYYDYNSRTFNGESTTLASCGFEFYQIHYCHVRDIMVSNINGYAWKSLREWCVDFRRFFVLECDYGVLFSGLSTTNNFDECIFNDIRYAGIIGYGITVKNSTFDFIGGVAICACGIRKLFIHHNYFEKIGFIGVDSLCRPVSSGLRQTPLVKSIVITYNNGNPSNITENYTAIPVYPSFIEFNNNHIDCEEIDGCVYGVYMYGTIENNFSIHANTKILNMYGFASYLKINVLCKNNFNMVSNTFSKMGVNVLMDDFAINSAQYGNLNFADGIIDMPLGNSEAKMIFGKEGNFNIIKKYYIKENIDLNGVGLSIREDLILESDGGKFTNSGNLVTLNLRNAYIEDFNSIIDENRLSVLNITNIRPGTYKYNTKPLWWNGTAWVDATGATV